MKPAYNVIIIGTGAAGFSAGIYSRRYLLDTLIIGEEFGGQTSWGGVIENYPGFKSIEGYELMKRMRDQAEALGAEILEDRVIDIKKEGNCFKVLTKSQREFLSDAIILATGSQRRRLNLPKEKELTGKGIHYCVTCDAPLYRGKEIAIVGGGDASVKGAVLAGQYASKIYLITREKEIRAEPINFQKMKELGDKVEILYQTEVKELIGEDRLEKIVLTKPYKGKEELEVSGLFIEIGSIPNTELAKKLGANLDDKGYLQTDNMMRTNIPGLFGAGDVVNIFGRFKQDITAAALGAVASTSAYEYIKGKDKLCTLHAKAVT